MVNNAALIIMSYYHKKLLFYNGINWSCAKQSSLCDIQHLKTNNKEKKLFYFFHASILFI